ncbi:MAG: hypothetical protein MOB07_24780 [Acidobacteria bacterium]|nr:hypothetical protein [Acidobacteriota bacterium]
MKINHEETKNTKKDQKKFSYLFVFFVSSWLIFRRSLHVALRRPETMKKRGAGFQPAPGLMGRPRKGPQARGQVGNLPHAFYEAFLAMTD